MKAWVNNIYPMVPLGRAIQHRKEFVEIDDFESYKRCRVQLHARGVVLRDIIFGSEVKTKKQQVCRAGEFLVAEIDAKVGGFGLVPPNLDEAIVSSHYFLFNIDEGTLDKRFLDYFVRTPAFRDQVSAQGSTNYAAIRPSHVLEYKVPLPPLPEQQRIVARIEELAARIKEARGLRRQAVEEARALWAAGAQELFAKPNGQAVPLRELVTVRGGGTPSKKDPALWGGEIPWVSPKDMKSREIERSIDYITRRATQKSSAKLIAPGAVLIVVRGMILAHTVPSSVLRVPATINQDMKALIPNANISPEYLCNAFWALNRQVLALVEKSSHDTRKLQTPTLLDFRLQVPSLPEQRRIVAYLDDLQAKVDSFKQLQAETAAELDALLPSVLDRAFKGEL